MLCPLLRALSTFSCFFVTHPARQVIIILIQTSEFWFIYLLLRNVIISPETNIFWVQKPNCTFQPSVLAWRIQGLGEPRGLPSMGSHRVRQIEVTQQQQPEKLRPWPRGLHGDAQRANPPSPRHQPSAAWSHLYRLPQGMSGTRLSC